MFCMVSRNQSDNQSVLFINKLVAPVSPTFLPTPNGKGM